MEAAPGVFFPAVPLLCTSSVRTPLPRPVLLFLSFQTSPNCSHLVSDFWGLEFCLTEPSPTASFLFLACHLFTTSHLFPTHSCCAFSFPVSFVQLCLCLKLYQTANVILPFSVHISCLPPTPLSSLMGKEGNSQYHCPAMCEYQQLGFGVVQGS